MDTSSALSAHQNKTKETKTKPAANKKKHNN
jgi:hypothetical protein